MAEPVVAFTCVLCQAACRAARDDVRAMLLHCDACLRERKRKGLAAQKATDSRAQARE